MFWLAITATSQDLNSFILLGFLLTSDFSSVSSFLFQSLGHRSAVFQISIMSRYQTGMEKPTFLEFFFGL